MCCVSAIYDYGRGMTEWDRQKLEEFYKLLEAAHKFDQKTGQPDCEDPSKKDWIEVVERTVTK